MPRAACAEQIALLCSAVLCAFVTGVTFYRQYRGILGEKTGGRERSNTCRKKKKKSSTQQHVLYPVLLYVRKKAHSAARHSTAAKGTAPLRTVLRCAARLYIAGLI